MAKPIFPSATTIQIIGQILEIKVIPFIYPISTMSVMTEEIAVNLTDESTLNWEVPWVKGLSAKALLSYDYNNKYSRKWYKEYYEYTYDTVNDVYNKSGSHTISELTAQSDNYFKSVTGRFL